MTTFALLTLMSRYIIIYAITLVATLVLINKTVTNFEVDWVYVIYCREQVKDNLLIIIFKCKLHRIFIIEKLKYKIDIVCTHTETIT